jgi:high-affinity iron transporter
MLASALIVFREVLEAGLVVGVVLAATAGLAGRMRWIIAGLAGGLVGAGLIAAFAGALTQAMAGNGQEVFQATVLIVAVSMLAWHNLWMAVHGRQIARQISLVGLAVASGERSLAALAIVVGVVVLREGGEVVLFLTGIAASSGASAAWLLGGAAIGVAGGVAVSWALYRGLLAIPLRHLFAVTTALIALLAAGMAGRAAALLAGANLIPAFGWQLWDTSGLLSSTSLGGRALQALVGYSDRPMGVQLAVWLVVLSGLLLADRTLRSRQARADARANGRPARA